MRFRSEDASLYLSGWTDKKPAGLFKVCHAHTFGDSLDASTLFSVHWIWASLYLPSRGHHTSPGKAEPPDYFSSSSTVRVQQQQFLQFLILCWLPEDFQCNVPSQKAKGFNAKLAPLSAYNHRCYIVLQYVHYTLYVSCHHLKNNAYGFLGCLSRVRSYDCQRKTTAFALNRVCPKMLLFQLR